jgi:hypothetical protein
MALEIKRFQSYLAQLSGWAGPVLAFCGGYKSMAPSHFSSLGRAISNRLASACASATFAAQAMARRKLTRKALGRANARPNLRRYMYLLTQ